MEQLVILVAVAFLVFPVWAIVRILALGRENNAVAERLAELQHELSRLRQELNERPLPRTDADTPRPTATRHATPPLAVAATPPPVTATPVPASPPPTIPAPAPTPAAPEVRSLPSVVIASETPAPEPVAPPVVEPPPPTRLPIDWEMFTGAKLFAWLGGIAAFLGVAFFVKYSFEHDLIPPEVRVALGFIFSIGLVLGGLKVPRPRYAVPAQTLIATGIVSLYAVTFACNSIYHFAFFGPTATFLLMSLITATAFGLAVRLNARVIAILGMLGGFLTPVLLSTGQDNPPGLFGYIALLDIGLIAVLLKRRWLFLAPLAALGTIVMEIGWALHFLTAEKTGVAMIVTLAFAVLFLGAYGAGRRYGVRDQLLTVAATAMPLVALGFAAALLQYATVGLHPLTWFVFVLLADACLLTLAWVDDEQPALHLVAGALVFALLAGWMAAWLNHDLLRAGLVFAFVFGALHATYPLVLVRRRPESGPTWWSQLFPPLSLVLMLVPLFKVDAVSFLLWPGILAVDALAVAVALLSGSIAVVAAVLVLTLLATGVWLFRVPVGVVAPIEFLLVVGGFAVLFFAAALFLGRRLFARAAEERSEGLFGSPRAQLPAFSALLPFVLLILMTERLPLANPAPVFGLGLLLVVLTLGLSWLMTLEWLPACALGGIAALAYAWHARHFGIGRAPMALGWYVGFVALFSGFPFAFRRRFAASTGPWAVAALSGAVFFPLVYMLVRRTWPNDFLGLLPAAFALPPLASLAAVLRLPPASDRARLNQLAWFGGVALLFITLIFPIQFSRQWLTLAWALEGAALLWLFQRVPHPGLRATGLVLLIVAFARLALNPAILEYHPRSTTPLLNWYLYSYGIALTAMFIAARLLRPPGERVFGVDARGLLNTFGTILAFLLVNLEIADFFSAPGTSVLTFQFSGNFARDMTYTIAWSVFALALLLAGIWKHVRAARLAALALLGVALLKLFLHDLARLDALYRVGALFAVATVAIAASFAYQRFLPSNDQPAPRDS